MTLSAAVSGPPFVTVPSIRPLAVPPAGLPAKPTVVDPCGPVAPPDGAPEELAVPAPLTPGALFSARLLVLALFWMPLPAPLGSLPELLRPPALPGPVTPLTAEVPAPADPALGAAPGLVADAPA